MTLRLMVGFLVLAFASTADAQTEPRNDRFTASGGVTWSGSYRIGDSTATYGGNGPGATPTPFTLFSARSTVESAAAIEGRVGVSLTPRLSIEAGGSFARPRVSVAISQDQEVTAQALEGEELQQYVFDAGLVWLLPVRVGRRGRAFVTGGAGYLRQLHQERTLVETGQVFYAGGGLSYWLRGETGTSRSFGLRAEARATWRKDGIDYDNDVRYFPSLRLFAFIGL